MDDSQPRPRSTRRLLLILGMAAAVVAAIAIVMITRDDAPSAAPLAGFGSLQDSAPQLSGEAAADFSVTLFDGTDFRLSDHLANDGRPVFLNLWASWCIPCRRELPAIDAAAARHGGVMFLGVAVQDDPTAARDFAEEVGVTFPLAVDESEQVDVAYPAFGLPTSFVISENGVILEQLFGEVDEATIDAKLATWFGG